MIDSNFARSSAYDNYYQEAKNRSNLQVLTLTPVRQIILSEQLPYSATGVVITKELDGSLINITANKEVIVSAGAHQSPQLLMLSGIGSSQVLSSVGLPTYVDNPNIGQNMQDHYYFSLIMKVQPTLNASSSTTYGEVPSLVQAGEEYKGNRTGVFTAAPGFTHGFQQLSADQLNNFEAGDLISTRLNQSHIEYYFEPIYFPTNPTSYYPPWVNETFISLTAGVIAPTSRGNVTLQSNSPGDGPAINLGVSSRCCKI